MTKVLLSLSDPLGAWAERQAANSNFDSVSDYVESLILRDQKDHESLAEFDRLVQEGEDSGISDRNVDDILAAAQEEASRVSRTDTTLRSEWFVQDSLNEFSLELPGIYQWSIEGIGVYVGKSKNLRKRLKAYPRNLTHMIVGRSYHGNPEGRFRLVHHSLLAGYKEERTIRLTILENCLDRELGDREKHWIALRRNEEREGGPCVLNAT